MNPDNNLGNLIARLRDQRFLFLVAVIVSLAVLAPLRVLSPNGVIIIFSISASIVVVDRLLDFWSARGSKSVPGAGNLRISIALEFEGTPDDASIRLLESECVIQNPHNPRQSKTVSVLPYPSGSGWLCPLPQEAQPDDRVSFVLHDSSGGEWGLMVVPRLLWPRVRAERMRH